MDLNTNTDEKEQNKYFWGCELSSTKKTYHWKPGSTDDDSEDEDFTGPCKSHLLILKQALIGATAVQEELNVVKLETSGYYGVIKQPIFQLKRGTEDRVALDVNIYNYCVLRLMSGTGPVYISGEHVVGWLCQEYSARGKTWSSSTMECSNFNYQSTLLNIRYAELM
uniref:Nucleoplasmin core domain-containing protein n=1 Tax=Strigamia maritima TaxID=126957 RepID=T1IRC6_STRMM